MAKKADLIVLEMIRQEWEWRREHDNVTPEEKRLSSLITSLDVLRHGPPIYEETMIWAREELCGGFLSELIAHPKQIFDVMAGPTTRARALEVGFTWCSLYRVLKDLVPEVVSREELARIDFDGKFCTRGEPQRWR